MTADCQELEYKYLHSLIFRMEEVRDVPCTLILNFFRKHSDQFIRVVILILSLKVKLMSQSVDISQLLHLSNNYTSAKLPSNSKVMYLH